MSGAHSRGNRACGGKIDATPTTASSRGGAASTCERLREQGMQVGARRWGGHTGGGEAQQSRWTARRGKRGRPDRVVSGAMPSCVILYVIYLDSSH